MLILSRAQDFWGDSSLDDKIICDKGWDRVSSIRVNAPEPLEWTYYFFGNITLWLLIFVDLKATKRLHVCKQLNTRAQWHVNMTQGTWTWIPEYSKWQAAHLQWSHEVNFQASEYLPRFCLLLLSQTETFIYYLCKSHGDVFFLLFGGKNQRGDKFRSIGAERSHHKWHVEC